MIVPVYDHPEAVKRFVALGLFGPDRDFGAATAIGFATEAEGFIAGVVYHNWEPDAGVVELSAYSTRRDWLNRQRLRVLFDYPFDQLQCRLVIARISERNTKVRGLWAHLGAMETRLPQLRADDEDEILAILRADAWRNSKFKR